MTRKRIIGFSLAVILLFVFFYLYGGSTVPQGQQPLVRLDSSNIGGLKDAFNVSANSVRLLVLVSPT
jgi:ABC-type transporter Mla subunit MlaD